MKYLQLPDTLPTQRLPFYLAMEEWAAKKFKDMPDDIFFMWQVNPTVIFGRNQRIESEVDLDYCRANNIQFYRRKSGGGCVFADMNNIMFSYITTARDIVATFAHYTGVVADFLCSLGLDASHNGRNDVLIGDRKVSGYAFYNIRGRCISHGTMLYDTDMTHISKAITPSRSKLESKGVKSVNSRITTVVEHLPELGIEEFKRRAVKSMTDGLIMVSESDIEEIREIEKDYYREEWIFGKRHSATLSRHGRLDGVGEFYADLDVRGGRIEHINLTGDFFMLGDLDTLLLEPLRGVELTRNNIMNVLADISPEKAVPGLTREWLCDLLTGNA